MLGVVERTGAVLDLFTSDQPEWGPTAVARELGIAKSQAHELLLSLGGIGFLRRNGKGRYRLGWRALSLREDLLRSEFDWAASSTLQSLAHAFGVAAELTALDRDRIVTIARRSARRAVRPDSVSISPGQRLHATATGKVLLATLEAPAVDVLMPDDGWPRFTVHTITSPQRLHAELSVVRDRGIAFESGELALGRRSAAVPITGLSGHPVAALGISADEQTWLARESELIRAVRGAGAKISGARLPDKISLPKSGRSHELEYAA